MKQFLLIPALVLGVALFAADTRPPTIQEIERLPFDDAFQQWLRAPELTPEIQGTFKLGIMFGSTDSKTGKSTPTPFWALTCRLGQEAHLHEAFLVSALNTNAQVSLILDSSPVLCRRYAVNSEAMVRFDPTDGYTFVMRDWVDGPDVRRTVWLDALKQTNASPNGAVNQSPPLRPETNETPSAADGGQRP
jgi:hypothetical protein